LRRTLQQLKPDGTEKKYHYIFLKNQEKIYEIIRKTSARKQSMGK